MNTIGHLGSSEYALHQDTSLADQMDVLFALEINYPERPLWVPLVALSIRVLWLRRSINWSIFARQEWPREGEAIQLGDRLKFWEAEL